MGLMRPWGNTQGRNISVIFRNCYPSYYGLVICLGSLQGTGIKYVLGTRDKVFPSTSTFHSSVYKSSTEISVFSLTLRPFTQKTITNISSTNGHASTFPSIYAVSCPWSLLQEAAHSRGDFVMPGAFINLIKLPKRL